MIVFLRFLLVLLSTASGVALAKTEESCESSCSFTSRESRDPSWEQRESYIRM